jgi:hypothetical protein
MAREIIEEDCNAERMNDLGVEALFMPLARFLLGGLSA